MPLLLRAALSVYIWLSKSQPMYASVFRCAVSRVLSHRRDWSDTVTLNTGAMYFMHLSLLVLLVLENKDYRE